MRAAASSVATPRMTVNPSGTVTITGDVRAIEGLLRANGVTRILPATNGVIVGRSDAEAAQRAMAPFAETETAGTPAVPENQADVPAEPASVPGTGLPGTQSADSVPADVPTATLPAAQPAPPVVSLGATGKAPAGGRNARARAAEANPFKAFLAKHGLAADLAAEFAPGPKERRAAMVAGYGPIFRKSGKALDVLAQAAAEEGFLPQADADRLYELVDRALRGERIDAMFTAGAAEREMQARIDRQRQLEEDAAAAVSELSDAELFAVEDILDDVPDLTAASNVPEADAMRSLGFTDEEISHASTTAEGSREPQAAGEGDVRAGEAAAGEAPGDRAGRDEEARPAAEGLTAPTKDEVLRQQEQRKRGERQEAERRKLEEQRASADAQRNEFTLTGSDRSADVAAAGGQQDLLAEPARGKIEDLGEKIGGARKDTATSTGQRATREKADDGRPTWAKRFTISQIVRPGGQFNAPRDEGRWIVHDSRSLDWMKQPRQVGNQTFATQEEAAAFVPLAAVGLKHRPVPTRDGKYEIWRDITDRKRVKVVDREFASRDDAMAYMARHAVEIIETNTTFGEADLPLPPDRRREGPPRRTGNVTGDDFMSTFGFRGVEFGNWNNQDERQGLMNDAYDGLMDLADVLGVPPKALGLNGDLALAFGARGQGLNSARAHYERNRAVINLTKEQGAGSLAHEWFHGLDHYFGRQDGKASSVWEVGEDGTRTLKARGAEEDMASGGFRIRESGVREDVRKAYENLITTIFKKATAYVEDTAKADQFTARAKDDLARELDSLRKELSAQKDPAYYKRNNKPASAEQLAEFDAIAKRMLEAEAQAIETDWRSIETAQKRIAHRWTNDSLEQLGAMFKAVRGRSGFDGTTRNGQLDRLASTMRRYSERLRLLADAQKGAEKTRMVPTEFAMNAKELDQGRGGDYWTTPHEMAARAFQAYVEDTIADSGGVSRFLNYAPENAGILTPWGVKRPYPHGAERKAINAALDGFVQSLETEETKTGVRLYALTDQAQRRSDERMPSGLTIEEARAAIRNMRGARAADVQKIVDQLTASWKNGPRIHVVQTAADLPGDNPPDVRGLYERGQVWIVAGAHRTGADVRRSIMRTLAHEAMAHYGLRNMLGREGWTQLMRNIQLGIKAGNRELRRIRDFVRETYVDADGTFYLNEAQEADEIAAKAVEEAIDEDGNFRPGFGFLKSTWARVAQFLRDLGIRVQFSNSELQGMLVLSMRNIEAGQRTAGGGQLAVAAAREDGAMQARGGDQTDTQEFKRWFGDSKVVDDEGRPLVVFHGTNEDFSTFERRTSTTKAYYFAADPAMASEYTNGQEGGNVLPVYLSLRNPMVIDAKGAAFASIQAEDGTRTNERALVKRAQAAGHDGLILRNVLDGAGPHGESVPTDVFVAFRPEQIKSAIGNRGTFDPFDSDIRHARGATANPQQQAQPAQPAQPATSPWRDATGRLQFAPGAWLYDKLGAAAGPLLAKLQLKAADPKLRRALREMKLQVAKAQETSAAVAGEAMKLTEAEREMVSDLIEQELQAGVTPPAHAVRLAAMINASMGAQTDELVRLGMLSADSADRWRDKYLPRFYRNKLGKQVGDAWADAVNGMFGRTRTLVGIKGKHLRGRGLYESVPVDQIADWEAQGWEVRDPEYEDFLANPSAYQTNWTADNRDVQMWRDFTRDEREKMGEIRDAGFRFVMGYMQTQRDIALGRMFEQLAQDPEMSSKRETKEFSVHVPDGTVPGTGAKRYGKLSGRWVSKDTMAHLSQIEEAQSSAWRMYRKALALWKEGKTALNPVSHVNNTLSNITMAHFAGVGYLRADKYLGAARDFATGAAGVKEAKDAGLFLGTLSDSELMNVLPEDLRALVKQQDSAARKVGRTAFDVMTFWLRRPMGWAYQAEDTFFRYLIYRDARERGMDPPDAVDYAQQFIFTYDDLPKGARMIRDFGVPFFAYTYKAVPALLHTALTHPLRMAAPAAVLWAANAAAYAIAAGDEDDDWDEKLRNYLTDPEYRRRAREKEKLEREHLPSWMKGTTALATPKAIRLGTDELTKLPLFIDTARIVPGGDLFDVSPNAGGIPLPQPITPSHPLFTTAVAMLGNKDMWTGKDLVDANDTRGEAAEKRTGWLWRQVSPAISLGNYHWERGMQALAQASGGEVKWLPEAIGERYTGIGRDGNPVQPGYAAAQTFGLKVRPIDLDMAETIDAHLKSKMIRDINAEIDKLQKLNAKGAISDSALEKEKERAQLKKDRLKEGLTVDGDKRD
jgi:hypothetical protein